MWVKLDDRYWINRKLEQAGWAARGFHAAAMSYCGDVGNDGYLTHRDITRLAGGEPVENLIETLVSVGCMRQIDGGYELNDFLEYNPTKEEAAEATRKRSDQAKRAAQARWERHRDAVGNAASNAPSNADRNADPTRPDHVTPNGVTDTHTTQPAEQLSTTVDVELCEHLRNRIAQHTGNKLKIGKAWHTDMSRLRRLGPADLEGDNPKTPDEIRAAIDFCFDRLNEPKPDGFCWANVTHSPAKLRKNWLKLEQEYQRLTNPRQPASRQPDQMIGVDLAFALTEQDPAA